MPIPKPAVLPITDEREEQQRALIVKEALSWIGTPYRQWGNSKGASIDCAMLLVRCWVDAGIFESFDPRPYPVDWHLHKKEERYLDWMNSLAIETDERRAGNIVLFRFGRCFSHAGILTSPTKIVHAYAHVRHCITSSLNEVELTNRHQNGKPIQREIKFFDIWAKLRSIA